MTPGTEGKAILSAAPLQLPLPPPPPLRSLAALATRAGLRRVKESHLSSACRITQALWESGLCLGQLCISLRRPSSTSRSFLATARVAPRRSN